MKRWQKMAGVAMLVSVLMVIGLAPAAQGMGNEILYDGTYTFRPNGDMAVALKFTMPMMQYQKLRDNVSNLYLLMRNLASGRADTEVVDKKPEWDDANRTVSFTMTVQGAARNLGSRWEMPVAPGAIYTTYNEKDRTFFFSEAGSGVMGTIRGTTKGVLPEGATQAKWDESKRTISYALPAPATVGGPRMSLVIPGAVLAGLGLLLVIASLNAGKPSAPAAPRVAPPQMPGK
jgi:hypothetical protein